MIKVFHETEPKFGMGSSAWPDGFTHVADVDTDDLEVAYGLTNHVVGAWTANKEVTPHGTKFRSTSVGDRMQTEDGKLWQVDDFGFSEVVDG